MADWIVTATTEFEFLQTKSKEDYLAESRLILGSHSPGKAKARIGGLDKWREFHRSIEDLNAGARRPDKSLFYFRNGSDTVPIFSFWLHDWRCLYRVILNLASNRGQCIPFQIDNLTPLEKLLEADRRNRLENRLDHWEPE